MMTVNKFIEIFMNSDFMYRTHLYHAILEGKYFIPKGLLEYDYISVESHSDYVRVLKLILI